MADEETNHRHHHLTNSQSPPPLGMRHQSAFATAVEENGRCGEIVEVQGGHILRSTGRKDRHSKVCTAKGPRDRRMRLSAPTAIQFYDVQDRLGFDRPSKAVDWLIKKAKSAIDDLAELPPWNPVDTLRHAASNPKPTRTIPVISPQAPSPEDQNLQFSVGAHGASVSNRGSGETEHHHARNGNESSFLPVGVGSSPPSNFPSRANTQTQQDLRLSLQSFQNGPPFAHQTEPVVLFSGQNNPLGFDSSTASWDQSPEFGSIQRLMTCNSGEAADSAGGGGFVFASPSSFQPVFRQSQLFSQRGPLQSINTPVTHAWFDPHHLHHHQSIITDYLNHHIPPAVHQSGIAFASNGEFSGLRIPARFQGEQKEHIDNKQSSATSDSCH